ncbi:crossover junction endonuclease MUS81-like [Haliotis rufescens]|uniref:crossover junction endonuclease MUS81-like n=1 Tax=Haliotis rufescens TaxID=6454 RepID=UPI00201F8637|nr:crossover junction endonuclease MUS81-like [Haliotis rufescens]
MTSVLGKRKKKLPKCPNPLFERWLQEWRDEAAEKGWKSQYIYSKALKSLKCFPLHLDTGKDCKILQNFGDKICKMLDDRLTKHIETYGSSDAVPQSEEDGDMLPPPHSKKTTNQSAPATHAIPANDSSHIRQTVPSASATHASSMSNSIDTTGSISLGSDEEHAGRPQRKRRKSSGSKGSRDYIPAFRSGAYAILLSLYRNMQDPDTRGFMTKAEIVRGAQPLADKSFSVADPGCRYTSWSSMGTLIKKGLIIKESSPAKYSLTDTGCELAHRLEVVDNGGEMTDVSSTHTRVPPLPSRIPPQLPSLHAMSDSEGETTAPTYRNPARLPALHAMSDSEGETTVPTYRNPARLPALHAMSDRKGETTPSLPPAASKSAATKLRYWYVTEDLRLVTKKEEAAVLIDDVISIGYLVKCNYQCLIESGKKYKLDTTKRLGEDFVYAYICDRDTDDLSTPPEETLKPGKNSKAKAKTRAPKTKKIVDANTCSSTVSNSSSLRDRLLGSAPTIDPSPGDQETLQHNVHTSDELFTASSLQHRAAPKFKSTFPSPGKSRRVEEGEEETLPDITPAFSAAGSQASSVTSASSSLPPPDFSLTPGSFDVVLCVDNREFYGGSKSQSKTLLPELIKNGVECDLRELQIGDMLWIARERLQPQPGQLQRPKGRELVLDFIIERKRMDDLVSSMIDGRFREQKFRLKRSGIANAIYLIEDYGSLQHFSIAEDRIKQAIVNTQVIDGFKMKRTSGVKETVAYLTVMTRYLQSFYRTKSLQACTPEMLRELDGSFHIEESEKLLTTFQHFNYASVKSKDLTVRELFGKQLIQLHGMSADKAKAITDRYPTPTSIFRAYDRCISQREKEGILANIKAGKGMRNLGSAQSKQIYQLFCIEGALT